MLWRDILVHVKSYEDWSGHIDVATCLAKRCGAHLTALYTLQDIALLKHALGEHAPAVADAEGRHAEQISQTGQRFREKLKAAGISGDWDVAEGNASELLTLAGRYHDLTVVEQTRPGYDEFGWDVAEECVMSSGRPTLVIPCEASCTDAGDRVLIAWNHSREAAAAVHGALPLIMRAQEVTVLIGEGKENFSSITRYPKLDIVGYLSRHNSHVSARKLETSDGEAGAKILHAAWQTNADVLVMGAYGRAAWREFFLGGATRHVFKHMTLPVLMAH